MGASSEHSGRKIEKYDTDPDDADDDDEEEPCEYENTRKSRMSLKDAGVILILSTLLSVGVVAGTLGVEGIKEKLNQNDALDILIAVLFFIGLFAFVSYLLVKVAAHYIVYIAVGTFLAIIFPTNRSRQRRELQKIFSRTADKKVD